MTDKTETMRVAEIRRQQAIRLAELGVLAVDTLSEIIRNPKTAERHRVAAAGLVLKHNTASPDLDAKRPEEMTADELNAEIARVRAQLALRAARARDVTPKTLAINDVSDAEVVAIPQNGIFD